MEDVKIQQKLVYNINQIHLKADLIPDKKKLSEALTTPADPFSVYVYFRQIPLIPNSWIGHSEFSIPPRV